jgi:hypothetical protein
MPNPVKVPGSTASASWMIHMAASNPIGARNLAKVLERSGVEGELMR